MIFLKPRGSFLLRKVRREPIRAMMVMVIIVMSSFIEPGLILLSMIFVFQASRNENQVWFVLPSDF
jgi:hypothetical protein